jgi:hypothetical protein
VIRDKEFDISELPGNLAIWMPANASPSAAAAGKGKVRCSFVSK